MCRKNGKRSISTCIGMAHAVNAVDVQPENNALIVTKQMETGCAKEAGRQRDLVPQLHRHRQGPG